MSPSQPPSSTLKERRRISFSGLKPVDKDREEFRDQYKQPPQTPRSAHRQALQENDQSYTNTDESDGSVDKAEKTRSGASRPEPNSWANNLVPSEDRTSRCRDPRDSLAISEVIEAHRDCIRQRKCLTRKPFTVGNVIFNEDVVLCHFYITLNQLAYARAAGPFSAGVRGIVALGQ